MSILIKIALTLFVAYLAICFDSWFFNILDEYTAKKICKLISFGIIGSLLLWLVELI
jgi:hypothetical protein